jgi:hypothetical protein
MIIDVHQSTRKTTTTIADRSGNVAGRGRSRAGVNAVIRRGETEVRGRGRARGGSRINGGRGRGKSNNQTTTHQDEVEETDWLAWPGEDPAQYANNEGNAENSEGDEDGKGLYRFMDAKTNLLFATCKPLENKFAGHHQPIQLWEKIADTLQEKDAKGVTAQMCRDKLKNLEQINTRYKQIQSRQKSTMQLG